MTIKKFQGKTQEEATEKARQELGAGAVVMNVKEIKPKGLSDFFCHDLLPPAAASSATFSKPAPLFT